MTNATISIEQTIDDLLKNAASSETMSEAERRDALKRCDEALRLATECDYARGKANALKLKGLHCIHLSQYKEALDAFLQEEKIRREIGDPVEIANATFNVANAYHYLGNLQKAAMLYLEAMQAFSALNEQGRLRSVYNNVGWLHFKIGNYAESLGYYLKCLEIAEKIGDKEDIAQALNAIGTVYQKVGDLGNALAFYSKSLKLCEEAGFLEGIGMAYGNIGIVYHEQKRYEEALEASYQSKRAFEECHHVYHLSMALASIAANYEAMKMENEAMFFCDESLKAAKKSGNAQVEVDVLQKQANFCLKRGENEEALHLLRNALRIAKKAQLKNSVCHVYRAMVEAYRAIGDFESALSAHEAFYEAEKELFNEESNRKIRNMQLAFELEQGKRETELERQKNVELTRLNQELSEANRLKSELLAIAAHDLKNPLQAILGFAELLKETVKEPKAAEYAQRIRASTERMLEMVTLLLQDAAISQGKFSLTLSDVDASQLCALVAETYRPRAEAKAQTIETQIEPNLVIRADRQCLLQILENLMSNAVKYSPEGKKIVVGCRASVAGRAVSQEEKPNARSQLLISVKDEGQGLTEEDKAKLFGKFQRLSAKPTGNESSTGLGLAIVKELVELHGGRIWAESKGRDKGTTFFVELPISQNA
ncbi:MAG: tetratricopeptide repeat-containing sensor histidine kinase [Chloroherpetonaceae bacterium]|nr:tetratricopeptide repeat-containing sensor histidine kinase [Chloroherpetonaceae bacterium]MDW8437116.1 tetratricopeptide repeat-containing sensor histidine kinase [Chloroherpetonaceae bacterium]